MRSARLHVTARGVFEIHLNGGKVGSDFMAPGWTPYARKIETLAYDVTKQLRPGNNVIGAILGEGWYAGRLGWGKGKATGNTPLEYAQRVKIEAAKKSFEATRKTINEVMYDVGYADVKAFREVFRKITGMSPVEYKGKYNKQAAI